MNWGDIQIESLQKMFLNNAQLKVEELEEYMINKKYKTYLFAMPQACNEAINYITSRLGCADALEPLEKEESEYYDLSEIFTDFKMIKKLIGPKNIKWKMINDHILHIENWVSGEINVLYEKVPTFIKLGDEPETEINLKREYVNLIPLYIAGELYKDDDISLATIYMNEFITMVNNYVDNNMNISNPSIETIYSIE